jgi:hypothetical protein
VRYVRTDSFKADYQRLSDSERALFRDSVSAFNDACDRFAADGTPFPAALRVKSVEGADGVFEMTWSFSGPDGRATWQWGTVQVEGPDGDTTGRAVVWRRIGNHRIFSCP